MAMLWRNDGLHPFAPPFGRTAAVAAVAGASMMALSILARPLADGPRLIIGLMLIASGIWCSARIGLSRADKIALGKTARRLRLL
jgi:hypothetical protein